LAFVFLVYFAVPLRQFPDTVLPALLLPTFGPGHWSLVIGHSSFVIPRSGRSLVIGPSVLVAIRT
jgi:hypothetical protein